MKMYSPIGAALLGCCLATGAAAQTSVAGVQVSLPLRSSSQMEPADAEVVAAHSAAIARAAAFYDFTLDSSWSYEQTVCPLAPQDIILNYSSRQARGVSSFSAVVPRQGSVIRIVPLAHDGTAPSVAPWGEHSYHVFNSITAESGGVRNVSTSGTRSPALMSPGDKFAWGLCYVALVNDRAVVSHPDGELHVFSATEPTYRLGSQGGSQLSFTVRDDARYYSVWQLEFSPKGALIRADRDQRMLPAQDLDIARAIVPEASPAESVTPAAPATTAVAQPSQAPTNSTQSNITQTSPTPSNRTQSDPDYVAPSPSPLPSSTQGESVAVSTLASGSTAVASMPAESHSTRKTKAAKSEMHIIPDMAPPIEHPIPDGGPLVTHPVPQS